MRKLLLVIAACLVTVTVFAETTQEITNPLAKKFKTSSEYISTLSEGMSYNCKISNISEQELSNFNFKVILSEYEVAVLKIGNSEYLGEVLARASGSYDEFVFEFGTSIYVLRKGSSSLYMERTTNEVSTLTNSGQEIFYKNAISRNGLLRASAYGLCREIQESN